MGEGGHGMGMGMGGGEGGAGVSCSGFDVQINGGCCQGAMEMVVHSDCIQGAPHYDQEGDVCDNDGTATEAYCSYDVESNSEGGACAYCTVPLDFSGGGGGKGGGKGMGGSKGMGGEGGKGKGHGCSCLDVSYDSNDNEVQTNGGCVSDHPDYPAWCDTSESTWGYCGSVDDWYSVDAAADDDADWMYVSGGVCRHGSVTTIATDESYGPVPAAVVATMSKGGKGGSHEHGSSGAERMMAGSPSVLMTKSGAVLAVSTAAALVAGVSLLAIRRNRKFAGYTTVTELANVAVPNEDLDESAPLV